MSSHLLTLIVMGTFVWTIVSASAPEPVSRSVASRVTPSDPAVASHVLAGPSVLEAQRPPIPLVRSVAALPTAATSPGVAVPKAEMKAQADLDGRAAKAAIEADGYKGVNVLGKAANGAWRAKAYRGTTEVQLTVDVTGQVSAE